MTTVKETKEEVDKLELRKVKALEKIANSLDALTIWFEEIDKGEWSERTQYYLSEFHRMKKLKTESLEIPTVEKIAEVVTEKKVKKNG